MTVHLGFVKEFEAGEHSTSPFISKLGGRPQWLNPTQVPKAFHCQQCNAPLTFLLQLYTPGSGPTFHRVVYVFICRNGTCFSSSRGCVKGIRCQLPEENPYWSTLTTADWDSGRLPRLREGVKASALCEVCGCAGSHVCGRCKEVAYCGKKHQIWHWDRGDHRRTCRGQEKGNPEVQKDGPSKGKNRKSGKQSLVSCMDQRPDRIWGNFPEEYELECDTVSSDEEKSSSKSLKSISGVSRSSLSSSRSHDIIDDPSLKVMPDTETGVDKAFLRLQERMSAFPDQVLRYYRTEYGSSAATKPGEPLWVSERGKPTVIQKCVVCRKELSLEFQVLSTILSYLPIDNADIHSLDFGTVLFYSCDRNCERDEGKGGWEELDVWCQNFSNDGMQKELRLDQAV